MTNPPDQLRQEIVSIYNEWGFGVAARKKILDIIDRERRKAVEEALYKTGIPDLLRYRVMNDMFPSPESPSVPHSQPI